ncbi:MAG: proline dehydrogenase family protein [Actinobacteria bacterium]|nr:proline dehydrogenase family protein [Actinomycetota bacterium]
MSPLVSTGPPAISRDPFAGLSDERARRARASVDLVRRWLTAAEQMKPAFSAKMLADVLQDPGGLAFTVGFVDGVVRPEDRRVAAHALAKIAPDVPQFLPWWIRSAVRVGGVVAPVMPDVVVPAARRVMRRMVGHLILDATPKRLGAAMSRARSEGVSLNVNLLGEAVLGREEAARRLAGTQEMLARDDVDYVSIKVSSTVAPHNPWAFDEAVEEIVSQLTPLFEIAAGAETRKFINLDMEEYRDLDLTVAVFMALLDKPEFMDLSAGIVLQTYLPDALAAMIRLQEWSANRRARGGADIKVRVVKGANLPMEQVEARVHGWPLATWHNKEETDTNYKRVLDYALTADRVRNVRVGIAGHNLFEIAYSWLLAQERGAARGVEYEMLLGMAQGQADAVRATVGGLRLYTPVVAPDHFDVAIAYLIRRLEEGATSANFMSAAFELVDSRDLFDRERDRFLSSLRALDSAVPAPHRVPRRGVLIDATGPGQFANAADTDPAVAANREWGSGILKRATESEAGVQTITAAHIDSQPDLDLVLARARDAGVMWGERAGSDRAAVLRQVGALLEANRDQLIEVAISETGKTIDQADPEASEAIDFAYYYADQAEQLAQVDGARFVSVPLTLVTPPWNFPLAIPAGSTLAALAAGSAVVLKPAPAARRCAAVLAELFWEAGIPRDVLSLVDLGEDELGRELISDARIDQVILTGAFETAQLFRSFRPDLQLLAETSGKNAIIVTPSADYDLAVKDIVSSAFGHAGQKCSAASLVVLVGSVGKSRRFLNQLTDAVTSLNVGSEFDAATQVGRVVEGPSGKLLSGLTTLEEGQTWLVEPRQVGPDSRTWSPGVRTGVARGSMYHLTEYFGPILGIMTADDLADAIDIVNDVDYGLTSGIHSLDSDELEQWTAGIHAGNLYINRGITGAIVRRQPFGGWKKSAVGPGAKAGGPNYLLSLGKWVSQPATLAGSDASLAPGIAALLAVAESSVSSDDNIWLHRCANSDAVAVRDEFGRCHDISGLEVERNVFRYVPVRQPVVIRLAAGGTVAELVRVIAAALAAGSPIVVSTEVDLPTGIVQACQDAGVGVVQESAPQWRTRMVDPAVTRIRAVGVTREELLRSADGRVDLAVWDGPVTEAGRVEMLPFLSEQAVSITAHRFGSPTQLARDLLADL